MVERSPEFRQSFRVHHREAATLRVENQVRVTRGFEQVQTHLRRLPQAPTTEEVTKAGPRRAGNGGENRPPIGRVDAPSSRFKTYTEGAIYSALVCRPTGARCRARDP